MKVEDCGSFVMLAEDCINLKQKRRLTKIRNVLNGSDKNWDGSVDIHDKMVAAKQKSKTFAEVKAEAQEEASKDAKEK
jgi:hypothetical protein